ncbi:Sensor kinase protein RcsC [Diplodia seriata]|uniref:histidine kinase n=2 Tax=Diplodia seriata TaxID=420778 RepID=A0A1S8BBN7_9PEZI|nr:Sensor kinase protein RcsC [Diplodia seriata]
MRNGVPATPEEPQNTTDRDSLCFACPEPDVVLHAGQPGFHDGLLHLYEPAESKAAEQLVKLKDRLRRTKTEHFFEAVTEGLAQIFGAQYAFVSKRIVVDDENVAVEMPPIGEPGACLMGAAFYVSDGHDIQRKIKNFKYHAYSCPCAYMKHDKIFIIPERLNEFIPENPNVLAIPGEAYLGVPLCAEGKCFAHFGVMWSPEGAANRRLRWSYMEMICHALEDMILDRLLEGKRFATVPVADLRPSKVVPHEAVTVAQSLKPYARSLSHELRTPMQGVVGMLDVMYATVQEAVEGHGDSALRKVFESLKGNIEVVQDSSRRAVEAADNVVHAYDMNMGVPESPESAMDEEKLGMCPETQPDIVVSGNHMTLGLHGHGSKRRRDSNPWDSGRNSKIHATETHWAARPKVDLPPTHPSRRHSQNSDQASTASSDSFSSIAVGNVARRTPPATPNYASESTVVPGLRHASIRDVIQYVINDSLKLGGRPESAIAHETDGGETIEVSIKDFSGAQRVKMIEWSVDSAIPDTILIDERDLAKMISCVFLNAVKFTEEGRISLTARLNTTPKHRYIVIKIEDSGTGIPEAFIPSLFKAFSREDDSMTRQSEGLGLGLLVAKGLARKLGGDLFCTRSETSGPNRGSEFEIRVPLHPGEVVSRPNTPMGSRSPSAKPRTRLQSPHTLSDVLGTPSTETPSLGSHSPMPRNPSARPSEGSPVEPRARPGIHRRRTSTIKKNSTFDRGLAQRHPLNFLVVEDNKINRKLLVSMLGKLGYKTIHEAYDGTDAVREMRALRDRGQRVDVVLMDLWMPLMDGYESAKRILEMPLGEAQPTQPKILAVSADVTDGALERAAKAGMTGFMTKPYKLMDLEKLIVQYCDKEEADESNTSNDHS